MASPPMRQVPEHDLQEPEYQISTTERSRLSHHVLKHDDAFALIDTHGDIGALGDSIGGLFFKDTRYLSRLELVTARSTPLLLNTTLDKPGLQQCCDLTNPDIYANDGLWLHKDVVHIYRTSHVRHDAFRQRLVITNFGLTDLEIGLTLIFDCDFSDIFEVR